MRRARERYACEERCECWRGESSRGVRERGVRVRYLSGYVCVRRWGVNGMRVRRSKCGEIFLQP